MEQTPDKPVSSGEIATAISNAVARIYAEHHGRGPARTKTFMFEDVILTILEESAAPAEQTLAEAGEEGLANDVRNRVQEVISEQLKAAVHEISGRRVRALVSGSRLDPDIKSDVFVLEREKDSGQP